MKKATSKDFIGIIAEEKPPLFLFRYKKDPHSDKIAMLLEELSPEFPLLNIYEYIIDENKDNELLAEHLELDKTPLLVFYKNSCFNRYKDKNFNKKALSLFLGSKRIYAKPPKEKEEKEV